MTREIWSVVLIVGLVGWITSTLLFIFKAFPEKDRFEVAPARIWGCFILLFFAIWLAGLLNA